MEQHLGYTFKDKGILKRALTHSSYTNEYSNRSLDSNETLEFLGDAVIDLIVCRLLMDMFPDLDEGELSKIKSRVVGTTSFSRIARSLNLGDHIMLGKGEEMTGGREKDSILAGTYEAVAAAIYLDAGFDATFEVIKGHIMDTIEGVFTEGFFRDYKTELQELTQRLFNAPPAYTITGEDGPEHDKVFEVEVIIDNRVYGKGVGKSKKEAEQRAASQAYQKLSEKR
ncbi:MAG: ribonuclease III [Thermodesulfobacteriota bacterium]